jgi:hypothetical protein
VEDWIGIQGKDQLVNVMVYPNPAKENVWIASEHASSLDIIDATGRVVYHDDTFLRQRNIGISGYPAGIYIIRLQSEDQGGKVLTSHGRMVIK